MVKHREIVNPPPQTVGIKHAPQQQNWFLSRVPILQRVSRRNAMRPRIRIRRLQHHQRAFFLSPVIGTSSLALAVVGLRGVLVLATPAPGPLRRILIPPCRIVEDIRIPLLIIIQSLISKHIRFLP